MKKNYKKLSDKELAELIGEKNGEEEYAFAEIYDRYSNNVFAYILRILNDRDAAEDIFQETFIRFHSNVTSQSSGSVRGYLITIARNLCLNYKRDSKSTVQIDEFEFVAPEFQNYENKELKELINMAVELLDMTLREPLVLRVYNGLDYKEIGQSCGITSSNARLRVHRAKDKIRKILAPYIKEFKNK